MSTIDVHARATFVAALATFGMTAAHHIYGAVIYDTPWRHHAAIIGAIASAALWFAHRMYTRDPFATRGRIGLVVLTCVAGLLAVVAFGAFEGLYNHVIKNVTYFAGVPLAVLRELFPAPTYELPNDVIFEVSGVLQVVPAAFTGIALFRLLRCDRSMRRAHRHGEASAPARAGLDRDHSISTILRA
jgi:hypothetical protein